MREVLTREQLAESYAQPYVRWLPVAYRMNHVPGLLAIAAGMALSVAAFEVAGGGAPDALEVLAVLAAVLAVAWTLWATWAGSMAIRAHTRDWRADPGELGRVRERRPHAPEADPSVAHPEYAVSVAKGGDLVTWCLEPLAANDRPREGELLLKGTPRYAGSVAERVPYSADAVQAAEQLADAQARAAELEAQAAERSRAMLAQGEEARGLQAETESTGAALRRITGQARD